MAQPSNGQNLLVSSVAVSAPLQGILYGFSVYMFGVTIHDMLRHRPPSRRINYTMLTMACLLFVLSTMSMVITIYRLMYAFVMHHNILDQPVAFFIGSWSSTFDRTVQFMQMILGDAIVLYRCYLVWSSILIIVLPALLLATTIGTGFVVVWTWTKIQNSPNIFFSNLSDHLSAAFLGSSIAGNAISTGLLAFRLWLMEKEVSRYYTTDNHLRRVVAHSGAIYVVGMALFLSLYLTGTDAFFIVKSLLSPITSICFYMVLLGARRRNSNEDGINTTNISLEFNIPQGGAGRKDSEGQLTQVVTASDIVDETGQVKKPCKGYNAIVE